MSNDHEQHDLEAKQVIVENIEQYGWHLGMIEESNYLPGFVFSIGLYKNFEHPEIICFGLDTEVLWEVLNGISELVSKGGKFETDQLYPGILQDYKVRFHKVEKEHYQDYLGYASWYYGSYDFPVLQLVWPDKQQKFPWEEGFIPDWKFRQPLLDRNTDFKFYEERNLGVYTTRQALEGETILFVYHNGDGDWQFHTSDHPQIEDAAIVYLDQLTKLDPSLNQVFHLQFGWYAFRESGEAEWKYAEDVDSE